MKPVFFSLTHKCGNNYFKKSLNNFVRRVDVDNSSLQTISNPKQYVHMDEGFQFVRLRNFTYTEALSLPSEKLVHCIRDPRSLIVSCTDYHIRGDEDWTRKPEKKYGGLSYSEYLFSASSYEESLIRSMQNVAGDLLQKWSGFHESTEVESGEWMQVKLEDLSRDRTGKIYRDLCAYIDMDDYSTKLLAQCFKKNSLWWLKENKSFKPKHSTSGVSNKTAGKVTGVSLEAYRDIFGDGFHEKFGYK